MATSPEKKSHSQMRQLRLRYDELNREFGPLRSKKDLEDYVIRLKSIVDKHLKNSGFEKQPVFVDHSRRTRVPISQVNSKGGVLAR